MSRSTLGRTPRCSASRDSGPKTSPYAPQTPSATVCCTRPSLAPCSGSCAVQSALAAAAHPPSEEAHGQIRRRRIVMFNHLGAVAHKEHISDILRKLRIRFKLINAVFVLKIDLFERVKPGDVQLDVGVSHATPIAQFEIHLNLRHRQVRHVDVLRQVRVDPRDRNHANFLPVAFVVNDADFLGRGPHHDAKLVHHLSHRALIGLIVQFLGICAEVTRLIEQKSAFHGADEAFETCGRAIVVDDGDALQLFLVALDLNVFVEVFVGKRLRLDRHVVGC
eukprot:CAMPEP_0170466150 /NCGR_PEP_ID=MMETSP0123-20130129/10222_1 /TAXON_ID=182087 /ORGANISM="Favella ehrenbergii, Strain Fehren 1" /LENGTH=277 /DNA_ID=CAMNT_0010732215 /DNA_START=1887 /DNA_END=2720 /DNA_ORIENTATION=+